MGFAVARTPNEVALPPSMSTTRHLPAPKMRLFAFYQYVKTVRLGVDGMAPHEKADSAILGGRGLIYVAFGRRALSRYLERFRWASRS